MLSFLTATSLTKSLLIHELCSLTFSCPTSPLCTLFFAFSFSLYLSNYPPYRLMMSLFRLLIMVIVSIPSSSPLSQLFLAILMTPHILPRSICARGHQLHGHRAADGSWKRESCHGCHGYERYQLSLSRRLYSRLFSGTYTHTSHVSLSSPEFLLPLFLSYLLFSPSLPRECCRHLMSMVFPVKRLANLILWILRAVSVPARQVRRQSTREIET